MYVIWGQRTFGLPRCLSTKDLPITAGDAGDVGSIPGLGRALEEEMATHSVCLPGESHGQRSLVGYGL